jgi:hypothetical protein
LGVADRYDEKLRKGVELRNGLDATIDCGFGLSADTGCEGRLRSGVEVLVSLAVTVLEKGVDFAASVAGVCAGGSTLRRDVEKREVVVVGLAVSVTGVCAASLLRRGVAL